MATFAMGHEGAGHYAPLQIAITPSVTRGRIRMGPHVRRSRRRAGPRRAEPREHAGPCSALTVGATLNTFGEPASETAKFGSTALLAETYDDNSSHSRDTLGRITRKTEVISGTTTTFDYTYDLLNRLTDVTTTGATSTTEHYDYDANGNRTALTTPSGTTSGTYDAQDRLKTHGTLSFTYTANGNLETKTDSATGAETLYEYDALGNLLSVSLPNGTLIEYLVDGQNRRVGKKINGALTKQWLYAGQLRIAAELDGAGNLVSEFVYGTKGNVPDFVVRGGHAYRVISDQLGSPRVVVDAQSGVIAQRIRHDAWGKVVEDTSPGFVPFGFAAGLYDSDTGLVRFGARDYDPVVGRWTRKDPILFNGGQGNLYVYASNDPVNRSDPGGRDPSFTAIAGGVVAGVGAVILGVGTAPLWGTGLLVVGGAVTIWDLATDDTDAINQVDKTKKKLEDVNTHTEREEKQLEEFDHCQ